MIARLSAYIKTVKLNPFPKDNLLEASNFHYLMASTTRILNKIEGRLQPCQTPWVVSVGPEIVDFHPNPCSIIRF